MAEEPNTMRAILASLIGTKIGAHPRRWSFPFGRGRFSGSLSFAWAGRTAAPVPLAEIPTAESIVGTTARMPHGPGITIIGAFDPLPQREQPPRFILCEMEGNEIALPGWSVHQFTGYAFNGSRNYDEVRRFSDFGQAHEAWLMLRSGASAKRVREADLSKCSALTPGDASDV